MFLKKIVLFVLVSLLAEKISAQLPNGYLSQWEKIIGLEKKGLTTSALQQVMIIYTDAAKKNNPPQQIKAALYLKKYRGILQQDSPENNLLFMDSLIRKATHPVKQLLQNIQAEQFWNYLQNNRYKIYNRTKLQQEKSTDISTWSLDKLQTTISKLYQASLNHQALLKTIPLQGYDAIINKGQNTRQLRPTLFDFLAFRALAFFTNDEMYITQPAYQFTIRDTNAFAPAPEFIKAKFKTKDSSSLHYHTLLLLQDILQFHLKDEQPDALLDADLIRLEFIYAHAVNEDKIPLYETALKLFAIRNADNAAAAQALFLQARIYYNRGADFDPLTKTTNQYEIKRARELCVLAAEKFPNSEGGINAKNLIATIDQPVLSLLSEEVNLPGKAFRTLVKYRNVPTIYCRVIKTTRDALQQMEIATDGQLWKTIATLKPIKSWSIDLPDPKDFQLHSTEIKIDALDNGIYLILASRDQHFSLQKNILSKQVTRISNISYINNNNHYHVLNRDNGQPINNAQVQVWETSYNYNISKNETLKAEKYTTDINGYFMLTNKKNSSSLQFQILSGNDELFLNNNNYRNYFNDFEEPVPATVPATFLFTDRAIYRPGQMVFFKGLVVKKAVKPNATSLLTSFKTTIQLRDANNQKLEEIKMTTNEFGSFHGSFKLPEGSLNGQFSLFDTVTSSMQYFTVEEYKRPKFFVELKQPAVTYRLLDSVQITGTAIAYAGNNIGGAAVTYRVVRKIRYPIWWGMGYGRKIMPPGASANEVEITNGITTTSADGVFIINFKALPDATIDKKTQPIFYYEISADVTDTNGETRSASNNVAVAYQMLQLEIKVPEKLPVDSLKNITIKSTTLNDIEASTQATLTIQKLKAPDKILRERYWPQPDQYLMSQPEYATIFPEDVYRNENEIAHYPAAEKEYEKTDSTNKIWPISQLLKAGWYKLTATAIDKYGVPVTAVTYLQLTGKEHNPADASAISFFTDKKTATPGEQINYTMRTGFKNIWLIETINKMEDSTTQSYQNISDKKAYKKTIAVQEKDRGGIAVNYVFVQQNRVYQGSEILDIPWSNKNLNISYSSFRDKLLPGSKEKWTLKITANKGEKIASEILASMYDASLDQFKLHQWATPDIWPILYKNTSWNRNGFELKYSQQYNNNPFAYLKLPVKTYDKLLFSENYFDRTRVFGYSTKRKNAIAENEVEASQVMDNDLSATTAMVKFTAPKIVRDEEILANATIPNTGINPPITTRKNFAETAFFLPDLRTDSAGNTSFSFTMPEALTQWKLLVLAHDKTLATGYSEKTILTQKPLMVQPNAPRFLREGDRIELNSKIVNLSDQEITGTSLLELIDASTNKPVDGWFKNVFATQYFTVAAGQSILVKFPVTVPFNFNSAITFRVTAQSTNKQNLVTGVAQFSDGEEITIPVLSNRILVTESLPLNLRNQLTKKFSFKKLLNSDSSETITHHALTAEFSTNPIWYAVQALPYLLEEPCECADQFFNRYYANTLAGFISNQFPKIKAVINKWSDATNGKDSAALLSNLQKNEELKSALLQETPWVLAAKNETQQKQNIASLFNLVKMSAAADKAIEQLKTMQSSNGGFVWFKGGPDDRYITQYILSGIGHLKKLGALSLNNTKQYNNLMVIVNKGIPYADKKIQSDFDNLLKNNIKLSNNNLGNTAIQYLYLRSFFTEIPISSDAKTAYQYYLGQAKKYWLSNNKYLQAMIALALHRTQDKLTPKAIIRSLKENALNSEDLGMYWKEWTVGGYYWQQAPIESEAMMIEAFTDIDKNTATVDDLKTWLLQQKQTQNWNTGRATAEACYALLLGGSNWLETEKSVAIQLGNLTINTPQDSNETGTGYFKKIIPAEKINPAMGHIEVAISSTNKDKVTTNSGTAWGAVYWQYFEDLDKITTAATPLQLTKKLFVEKNSDNGPVLQEIADGATLKVGDKIKVRIGLKSDREMEYVQMKDLRAACMEPVNVLSEYKYQDGVGYYQTTKDASTSFFFSHLPRGNYVFEYALFVTHAGNFSNGITTIQCNYAPEFSSHSEGIRVTVE